MCDAHEIPDPECFACNLRMLLHPTLWPHVVMLPVVHRTEEDPIAGIGLVHRAEVARNRWSVHVGESIFGRIRDLPDATYGSAGALLAEWRVD